MVIIYFLKKYNEFIDVNMETNEKDKYIVRSLALIGQLALRMLIYVDIAYVSFIHLIILHYYFVCKLYIITTNLY